MKPISPVIPGHSIPEVVYAKDQPQYLPLPSIREPDGCVTTRWKLTWKERLKILFHGCIYHVQLTFNSPIQPIRMGVDPPDHEAIAVSLCCSEELSQKLCG